MTVSMCLDGMDLVPAREREDTSLFDKSHNKRLCIMRFVLASHNSDLTRELEMLFPRSCGKLLVHHSKSVVPWDSCTRGMV